MGDRRARLIDDGWKPCGTCGGSGRECDWCRGDRHGTQCRTCPNCVMGLVPSMETAEVVAKALVESDKLPEVNGWWLWAARTALVEAERWAAKQ